MAYSKRPDSSIDFNRFEGNKLAQYTCAIEQGENMYFGHVNCQDAIAAEWVCGYPGNPGGLASTLAQISGTIFDHIQGGTLFDNFGPISLKPAENFLASYDCAAEEVVHSYFNGGWIAILDAQRSYNLYDSNIEDTQEPFNAEYCVEITGHSSVSNNRCDNRSGASVYVTGSGAVVHDATASWNNAWAWPATPWGGSYGVILAPGTGDDLVDGVSAPPLLTTPAQIVSQQGPADPSTIIVNNPGAPFVVPGPGYGVPNPQGRLTLQSGAPVMTGNTSGASTIYYDCYTGQNVPYFNGGTDSLDPIIPGCEMNAVLRATGTGMENANDVFDIWWWHNAGSPALCVATNGSGAGWSGDGGSLSSRGSGYTQLNATARGYLTNKNAFTATLGAHCYNLVGTSAMFDFVAAAPGGMIPANSLTYLGSFYTTAAGQTSFVPQPAPASGGANAIVAIWNGYNRVPVATVEQDTATAYGAHSTTGWEIADAGHTGGSLNYITVLDGNQQTPFDLLLTQVVNNPAAGVNPELSTLIVTGTTTCLTASTPSTYTSQQSASPISVAYKLSKPPLLGLQCAQALEKAGSTANAFNNNSALTFSLNWQY